jgi:hypothetical protein
MAMHAPFTHAPLQQSAPDAHVAPSSSHGNEQLPAKQSPLQQSAFAIHGPVVGVHPWGG